MNCPYCGGPIETKLENLPMSFKRRQIYKFILKSGQDGVSRKKVVAKFMPLAKSPTTLRTTIHYINKVIHPLVIYTRGGIMRVSRDAPTTKPWQTE